MDAQSVIVGIIVVGGFFGILGYAFYKTKKFDAAKAALEAQIKSLQDKYENLRK